MQLIAVLLTSVIATSVAAVFARFVHSMISFPPIPHISIFTLGIWVAGVGARRTMFGPARVKPPSLFLKPKGVVFWNRVGLVLLLMAIAEWAAYFYWLLY